MSHKSLTADNVDRILATLAAPTTSTERSLVHRVGTVRYLVADNYAATMPRDLISPTPVADFVALSRRERLALIALRIEEHSQASRRAKRPSAATSSGEARRLALANQARQDAAASRPA